MILRPPRSTRTDTLFPYTTLFRSSATPAIIDPNYLATDYDRRVSVALFRFIRAMFTQPALAPFVVGEIDPSAGIETDDEIIDAYHRIGGAGYHAAGTCRMGTDDASVVDTRLRVREIGRAHV